MEFYLYASIWKDLWLFAGLGIWVSVAGFWMKLSRPALKKSRASELCWDSRLGTGLVGGGWVWGTGENEDDGGWGGGGGPWGLLMIMLSRRGREGSLTLWRKLKMLGDRNWSDWRLSSRVFWGFFLCFWPSTREFVDLVFSGSLRGFKSRLIVPMDGFPTMASWRVNLCFLGISETHRP